MYRKLLLGVLCCVAASSATVNATLTPDSIASKLRQITFYNARVDVLVELPMASNDEVTYTVNLSEVANEPDSLLQVSYLIDWTLPRPQGDSHGFAAYFNGNHYRYRDGSTIKEYHADADVTPFLSATPVQKSVQFFELLPWALGAEIDAMVADSTFTLKLAADTLFRGNPAVVLEADRVINGIDAAEMKFVFDPSTLLPVYIEKEMSPGSISEQTLEYTYHPRQVGTPPTTEEQLIDLYPEIFSNFREGSYALQSLVGREIPSFSLPTLTGTRLGHTRGQQLPSPTIIVFVDEQIGSTPQLLTKVSHAVNSLPMNVDVWWIYLSNRRDEIEELHKAQRAAGTVLTSGRNVTKDFGITSTPSLIFVGRDGKVADIVNGFNNDIGDIVIQKTTLLN